MSVYCDTGAVHQSRRRIASRLVHVTYLCDEGDRQYGSNVADEAEKSDSGKEYKRSRGLHVDRDLRAGRTGEGEVQGVEEGSRYCNT